MIPNREWGFDWKTYDAAVRCFSNDTVCTTFISFTTFAADAGYGSLMTIPAVCFSLPTVLVVYVCLSKGLGQRVIYWF